MSDVAEQMHTIQVPSWDLSKVRPAGAKLKTFGGRASGPKAAGRKLTSIECHDLCCKIAEVVVVGGGDDRHDRMDPGIL